jgi:hypothetical protein
MDACESPADVPPQTGEYSTSAFPSTARSDGVVPERVGAPAVSVREGTVAAGVVYELVRSIERAGRSGTQLACVAGLDLERLQEEDARVPLSELYRLCELALDLTNDPALGLHSAERINPFAYRPVSNLIAHARTLRHALSALVQFQRLLSDERSCEVLEEGEMACIRRVPRPDQSLRLERFCAEKQMVGLYRMVRMFAPRGRFAPMSFAYPAPP